MCNVERCKSKDGYSVYKIEKEDKQYYLGDNNNYKKNIDDLIINMDGVLFDSIIFIFGIDTAEYIDDLKSNICNYNKVIIIEPNEEIYGVHEANIAKANISLLLYEEEIIEGVLNFIVNYKNFNRLHVHCFGNYEEVYKEEYNKFIELLDRRYEVASSSISLDNKFKKIFFENMVSNLYQINSSSPLNSYIGCNKNIPAIIVSAGPSLDKNIKTMLEYKDNLKNFFIIAGNRTMGTLIRNGISPNLIISIDPAPINHEMMKDYLNSSVPFAFYEYSNKDLVNEYKGEKIYISQLFSKTIEDFSNLSGTYSGGSVAHTCIDTARIMGCNPIILVGQDCAFTYGNHHSKNATFNIDRNVDNRNLISIKDVYQNEIKTTKTLDFFRIKIEEYIRLIQDDDEVKFINVSYGADIEGAPHKELEEVLKSSDYKKSVEILIPDKNIKLEANKIIDLIYKHINTFIEKSEECINICNELLAKNIKESLMDIDENDENLQKFLYVMEVIDDFEFSQTSYYLGSYLTKFLFDIRQKYFEMEAKDYETLSSNFNYQSETFLNYFQELNITLKELKDLF
ncbi:MAG: motility associated factor glycosyltransferase family protein [Romboutsia sp.]|uniref:motility associated factor glycosyltransferase family protein n=1 Tax=Romboutsia sp. TaxID=1965302 RepID=UPI003F2DE13A